MDYIYSQLDDISSTDFTGLQSSTAKVTVDNEAIVRTIKVDVNKMKIKLIQTESTGDLISQILDDDDVVLSQSHVTLAETLESAAFDSVAQKLYLTLSRGTVLQADLSSLVSKEYVDQYVQDKVQEAIGQLIIDLATKQYVENAIDSSAADLLTQVGASISATYANNNLKLDLINKGGDVLSTRTVTIPTEQAFVNAAISGTFLNFTRNNGQTVQVNLANTLSNYVLKESGKGLSTNDYTTPEKTKLGGIQSGAEVNIITGVKFNGVTVQPTNRIIELSTENKVDKIPGKGLSTNDYTTDERTKLAGIEPGAEVNIIEDIKVNGSSLSINNKSVNIDLTGKVDKVAGKGLSTNDFTTAEQTKLGTIAANAQVNVLEGISVNGTVLPINASKVATVTGLATEAYVQNYYTELTYNETLAILNTTEE